MNTSNDIDLLSSSFNNIIFNKPLYNFNIYCMVLQDNYNNDILYYFSSINNIKDDINFSIKYVFVLNLYNTFISELFNNLLKSIQSLRIFINEKYVIVYKLYLDNDIEDLNSIINNLSNIDKLLG
jgi:hypothetical protein